MKLRIFTFFLLAFSFVAGHAQDNAKRGLQYLDDLQYHKARNSFFNQLKATPGDAKIYYSLGDAYIGLQLPDSAKAMYQKALDLDPKSPFPLIGFGKLALLKGDRMGKVEYFEKAKKADRKNLEVYNEIAKGCFGLAQKDTTLGDLYLQQGFALDAKYAPFHLSFGDHELLGNRFGSAVNAYERAIFFDPTSTLALRKLGVLQTLSRSYRDAINTFNKCITLNSDQIMVYKNLGDLYYVLGKYPDAGKNYKFYMAKAEITYDDKERYSFILFFNKQYAEADAILEDVISQNSDESVLFRIRGYIACETGEYAKGLENMTKFFKLHDPAKNLASDYLYYGRLLQKNGKDTAAIISYKKALVLDTTKTEIYDDLARLYSTNKMHEEAIFYFKKMITNGADKVNTWFQIGKEYYFEGDMCRMKYDSLMTLQKVSKIPFTDSVSVNETKRMYFQKADSAFAEVTVSNPQYAGGFMWRGRMNAMLDPEATTPVAKDSYEKALALLEVGDAAKNRKSIIECYKFLGSYYFLNGERLNKSDKAQAETLKTNSLSYFRKILAIDPNDAQALDVFKKLKIAI